MDEIVLTPENEPIDIRPGMKGIWVLAVLRLAKEDTFWVLLIGDTVKEYNAYSNKFNVKVFRHISYNNVDKKFNINLKQNLVNWGLAEEFAFYKLTEEQKKIVNSILKKEGYKYVRIINKIIKR